MKKQPTSGGSYVRDAKTGALIRLSDTAAQTEEGVTPEASPKPEEPTKKGAKQ